jgi:hypothetical protein
MVRVNAGIAKAQRKGTHCGRPNNIFRRDEVLRLRALDPPMSFRKIAAKMGVTLGAVQRVVKGVLKGQ